MSELKAARHLSQWISEGALFRMRIACFCPESSMYSETMKPATLSSRRDGERMAVLELEAQAGERTATTTLSNVAHTIIICTWSQTLYSKYASSGIPRVGPSNAVAVRPPISGLPP